MKQLKAIKNHTYANRFQRAGDVYPASDGDAKLMVLLKHSEYFVEKVPKEDAPDTKAKRPYVRKNEPASDDKTAGTYSRKDMKAE